MSSVDNRIVEMQFNNKRFEENAKTSMSTLDKLKEKLNFSSATKDLKEFQNSADSLTLDKIAKAVEGIGEKFTLLGNLGQRAMQKIADSAINAGITLAKSLTIDQISAGMSKYEQETNTVQALYAALKPKGKSLQDIYDVLDLLTAYSDETSYSYTQMADGVSKFVAAGQDINDSEVAMEGIANAAALAGVSIQDAGRAFTNFSDAMGKGYFQLSDWKSIQLIHMDTEAFKQTVIETAAEVGTLTEEAGKFYIMAGKNKEEVTAANFQEYLRYGFFNREVIMKTMAKYADRESELGASAFAAAQNAKTFTDVIDAAKDASSTGWKTTFRLIFGDLEEAIALFTPMANELISVINEIDEFRNSVFQGWRESGGRGHMIEAMKNIWNVLMMFKDGVYEALGVAFDMQNGVESATLWLNLFTLGIENSTRAFSKWLADEEHDGARLQKFQNILNGVASVFNFIRNVINGIFTAGRMIFDQLKPSFEAILDFLGEIGEDLNWFSSLDIQLSIAELAIAISNMLKPLTSRLPAAIEYVHNLYKEFKKAWNTNPRLVKFRKSVSGLVSSILNFMPKAIEQIFQFGEGIINLVKNSDEWKALKAKYNQYVKPWLSQLTVGATKFNETLTKFFNTDTSDQKTLWGKLKKRFSVFGELAPWLNQTWNNLKKDLPWLQELETWWNTSPFIKEMKGWAAEIGKAIDIFFSTDTSGETSLIGKIKIRFQAMMDELVPFIERKWTELKQNHPWIQQIEDFIKSVTGSSEEVQQAAGQIDEKDGDTVGSVLGGFFGRVWAKIEEYAGEVDLGKLGLFGLGIAALVKTYKFIKSIGSWGGLGEKVGEAIEGVTGVLKEAKKKLGGDNGFSWPGLFKSLLFIAASTWLMADALMRVSELEWEKVGVGLTAMFGILLGEGGFIVGMSAVAAALNKHKLWGSGFKNMQLIAIAGSMWILAQALVLLSQLSWEQIGVGLTAMGALFIGDGAFLVLVNRLGAVSILKSGGLKFATLIGTAVSMYLLAMALERLAQLDISQVGAGLLGIAGLFFADGAFMILVNRIGAVSAGLIGGLKFATLIGTAVSMYLLVTALERVSKLSWPEVENGLIAMGGLFAESGAFMVLVNRLGAIDKDKKGGLKLLSLIGTAASIYILVMALEKVAALDSESITKGLIAIGVLLAELAGFMFVASIIKSKGSDPSWMNATASLLGVALGQMAKVMIDLAKLSIEEITRGSVAITVIAGVLVAVMWALSAISKDAKPSQIIGFAFSTILVAGAIWLMVKAFEPLTKMKLEEIGVGILGLIGVAGVLAIFMFVMKHIKIDFKSVIGAVISAIVLATTMIAFAHALTMVKDIDPAQMLAFGAAMVLVSVGMIALAGVLTIFSTMSLGSAIKASAIMLIAALAIAAAVGIIVGLTAGAAASASEGMASVGANLAAYSEQVEGVDEKPVNASLEMLTRIAGTMSEIGLKQYGDIAGFNLNLSRLGSALKLFHLETAEIDTAHMESVTSALNKMSIDLAGLKEVSDVSVTIGNIAGAIKLYSDSVDGVTFDTIPDMTDIQTVFESLLQFVPDDDSTLSEIASYSGKGNDLTLFAIGLENIATAVSTFSSTAKDLDYENIDKAIEALSAISKVNEPLATTEVSNYGLFTTKIERETLTEFSLDVIALGTALGDFNNSISGIDEGKLRTGTEVLVAIGDLNAALPSEGGVSQWFTGNQSLARFGTNLRLLGGGAKAFSEAVSGTTFDQNAVDGAADAIVKIAEANGRLPLEGGIREWFEGSASLNSFSNSLGTLGTGLKNFFTNFGSTTVSDGAITAITKSYEIINFLHLLGGMRHNYNTTVGQVAKDLNDATNDIQTALETIGGYTWEDGQVQKFKDIISYALSIPTSAQGIKYDGTLLTNIGKDMKGLMDNIWLFLKDRSGSDIKNKIAYFAESIANIGDGVADLFSVSGNMNTLTAAGSTIVTLITDGFTTQSTELALALAVNQLCASMCKIVKDYNGYAAAGTWVPYGFAVGIMRNRNVVLNATTGLAVDVINAFKRGINAHSPSKKFMELGMYADQGLALGLTGYTYVVDDAADQVSSSAINTVLSGLSDIYNLPLEDMDLSPTIRPVLDTSDISAKAGIIDNVLSDRSLRLNTSQIESSAQLLGEAAATDLSGVNQRIGQISGQLEQLQEALTHMQIVLNGGALVGALASDIDKTLGARARRSERGQ